MFTRLALLFVVVPLVELALLIQVGQWVGLMPTVLLVLGTGIAGAALARREGLRTLASIQASLAGGQLPGTALMDGAAILFGGALLLTPGILTDLVGFSLLAPPTRRWFARRLRGWFERQLASGNVTWTVGTSRGFGWGQGPVDGPGGGGAHGGFPDDAGHARGAGLDEEDQETVPSGSDPRTGLDPRNEIRSE